MGAGPGQAARRRICSLLSNGYSPNQTDENGGTTRHPGHMSWPLEMRSIFTFEELPGGKTKFTVSWEPHNATEEERKTFEAGRDSMRMGWSGTLEKLEGYLTKAK